jgi:diguanylate cyclase (GGDEF)-like protein
MEFPRQKRELSKEEVQDAQIGLLEWELEDREERHGTDPLTGARRREVLIHELDQSLKRIHAEKGGHRKEGISIIFIDLDQFKQVNDALGHPAGDRVLKRAADLLRGPIRATDMLARYGGDEFVVFLPNTNEEHALIAAEKLRTALENDAELRNLGVTASLGVCSSDASEATDPETFIAHADEAALAAKRGGKNRVEVYS